MAAKHQSNCSIDAEWFGLTLCSQVPLSPPEEFTSWSVDWFHLCACEEEAKIKAAHHLILTMLIWPYNLFEARFSWREWMQSSFTINPSCFYQHINFKSRLGVYFPKSYLNIYLNSQRNFSFFPDFDRTCIFFMLHPTAMTGPTWNRLHSRRSWQIYWSI